MMREILGVAQDEADAKRRWFHDDYFDLFIWQTDAGETTSFQLCYGADSSERALVWHKERGWFEDGNATADPAPAKNRGTAPAPAGLAGAGPTVALASRFESAATALPEAIRTAVGARLREYAGQVAVTARRTKVRRAAWQKNVPGPG